MNQQYVALSALQGEEGRIVRREQLRRWAQIQEAKQNGVPLRELPQLQSKLQRMKTYILGMNIINMMKQLGVCISGDVVKEGEDGTLPCPFTWHHFNAALDRGSDCVLGPCAVLLQECQLQLRATPEPWHRPRQ